MKNRAGFNNLLKNSGYILTGNAMGSVFGLLVTMLLARQFGPEKLGALALMQAFIMTVRSFFGAQSWQAIVKFGVVFFDKARSEEFFRVVRTVLFIETSIVLAGGVFAVAGATFFSHAWGLPAEYAGLGVLYCFTIFLKFDNFFSGIIQLFNRFKLVSYFTAVTAAIRLVFVLAIFLTDLSFERSVYLLITWEALSNLAFSIMGMWVYRQETGESLLRLAGRREGPGLFRDIASFLAPLWTWSTLRMLPRELDVFILGVLTNTYSVGQYKVVKQFASVLLKLHTPLHQAIFP
ncbi:MAG TPA: oligosaccharide flippase family protein, partial [Nitrospirota bacterium]